MSRLSRRIPGFGAKSAAHSDHPAECSPPRAGWSRRAIVRESPALRRISGARAGAPPPAPCPRAGFPRSGAGDALPFPRGNARRCFAASRGFAGAAGDVATASCAGLRLDFQETGDDVARLPPVLNFRLQLLSPGARNPVKASAAIVVRRSPLRLDRALLLQPQEQWVKSALVQCQPVTADLFDTPRDAVAVQRAQSIERLQRHQRQRSLLNVRARHRFLSFWLPKGSMAPFVLENNRRSMPNGIRGGR